ncbi:hypothetical protein AGIG_G25155 [Arapaima gigas]
MSELLSSWTRFGRSLRARRDVNTSGLGEPEGPSTAQLRARAGQLPSVKTHSSCSRRPEQSHASDRGTSLDSPVCQCLHTSVRLDSVKH